MTKENDYPSVVDTFFKCIFTLTKKSSVEVLNSILLKLRAAEHELRLLIKKRRKEEEKNADAGQEVKVD